MTPHATRVLCACLALVAAAACSDGGTGSDPELNLDFSRSTLELGSARSATVVVRNTGEVAVGPVDLVAEPVLRAGIEIPGVAVVTSPDAIATLNPGDSAVLNIEVEGASAVQAGAYSSRLLARVQGTNLATAMVTFDVEAPTGAIADVEITALTLPLRQGDVIPLDAVVVDTAGEVVADAEVAWSTLPAGRGLFTPDDEFVPYTVGDVSIVASSGGRADTLDVTVSSRGPTGSFSVVGSTSETRRFTSDLWLHGDVAYTGTWSTRMAPGNAMYVWNVSGSTPVMTDSVRVDAFTVNDVKISADGTFAVLTHEYMSAPNAVTILDMTDPEHPGVAGRFVSDEPGNWVGVHNVWIDGDYVYLVVDGTAPNRGLWILDVSDRANPERVGRFYGGSSFLHDVYVRDGLAFLSHWNAGLIILDVGHGIRGGSPEAPVEVSRVLTAGGQTHNAWYWPETGYVFVGEEDFGTPGRMHVIDASDLENPVEVANFRLAGDTPHNFWLDEDREILYMAWYSRGLQALDVSGPLHGSLDLQGRIVAELHYAGTGDCPGGGVGTCTWAPQLHDGFVYISDMNSGVWKLQPDF